MHNEQNAGKKEEYGSYTDTEGTTFEGFWKEHKKHGIWLKKTPGGNQYDERWENGHLVSRIRRTIEKGFCIKSFIDDVYLEFVKKMSMVDKYCDHIFLSYENGNIPDYSLLSIQQLYLIRYGLAYYNEYYDIFKKILTKTPPPESLHVLSVGSGAGLDYYAAISCIAEIEDDPPAFSYTGIDLVDWCYRPGLNSPGFKFYQSDVIDFFRNCDVLSGYNMIILPKSIGEFKKNTLNIICERLAHSNIRFGTYYIIASVRNKRDEIDKDFRFIDNMVNSIVNKRIFNASKQENFERSNSAKTKNTHFLKEGINIIDELQNLNSKCPNGKHCTVNKCESFRLIPILTNNYRNNKMWVIDF